MSREDASLRFRSIHHSVGQGLMSSGVLKFCQDSGQRSALLTTVFDCGTVTGNAEERDKRIYTELEQLGCSTTKIDVLYISHFDEDHVNGLPLLIPRFRPTKVVMPAVPAAERLMRIVATRSSDDLLQVSELTWNLVLDPVSHLEQMTDGESEVILLEPNIDESVGSSDPLEPPDASSAGAPLVMLPTGKNLGRGVVWSSEGEAMWLLRPWVQPPVQLRTDAFIKALGYPDEDAFNRALPDLLKNIETERGKIRAAYEKVVPRKTDLMNFTSLCLYSGPPPSLKFYADSEECEDCWFWFSLLSGGCCISESRGSVRLCPEKPGWISTGDATLKPRRSFELFKTAFKDVFAITGQVTLPHHGSSNNIRAEMIEALPEETIWIASSGSTNTYGHPSHDLLQMLTTAGRQIVLVNESASSRVKKCVGLRQR